MYYIYHIPGVKIGCTKNYPARPASQSDVYELLETHHDVDVASDREMELQVQYGYGRDSMPYVQTLRGVEASKRVITRETRRQNMLTAREAWVGTEAFYEHQRNANPNLGRSNKESGHWDAITNIGRSIAQEKIVCEYCGKESNKLNHGRWHGANCKNKNQE